MRKCPGCQRVIPPGLILCGDCREKEARVERDIAVLASENLAALERSLAAHAAFEQWLIDHDQLETT